MGELRNLPKVDDLLQEDYLQYYLEKHGRQPVLTVIREVLESIRRDFTSGRKMLPVEQEAERRLSHRLKELDSYSLKRVINGTGIVLHTNLGRAALAEEAIQRILEVADKYSNLEYSLEDAARGIRYSHVEDLLCHLTGAEAALVVNNNAAAVLLALNTLASGKEAVVSRGQLIEIGGSFRIPEVMKQSGCRLVEVGTTNKTRVGDYRAAINEETGLLLKVHSSNYRILGFTEEAEREELRDLAAEYSLPLMEDLGSGLMVDMAQFGLSYEPTVREVVASGVDVVTFSGDKLLGGPQAGIIVGKEKYISKMKKNHLNRALRIDKLTLAALEATLKLYLDEQVAKARIPVLRMLDADLDSLCLRAENLAEKLESLGSNYLKIEVVRLLGEVGGGSLPLDKLESYGLAIEPLSMSVNEYEEKLRLAETPLIAMIQHDRLTVDLRTIHPREEEELVVLLLAPLVEVH